MTTALRGILPAFLVLLHAAASGAHGGRPPSWAHPLDRPGLPNLYRFGDGLYRSAQPDGEGLRSAAKLGIRTVLNLRSLHSDAGLVRNARLRFVRIPMLAHDIEEQDIAAALRVLVDPDARPLLVHCRHGSDRTGVVVAAYRIVVEGWSKEEALRELREGGFGFHEVWGGIPRFLREMDVPRMRLLVGVRSPLPRRRPRSRDGRNAPPGPKAREINTSL
jgi:protein tyrosine phosphatase (PTP) superfamily phosphohydrolase (DUF442 family)